MGERLRVSRGTPNAGLTSVMSFVLTQMDVTEVFRQIPREKNIRIAKLIFYLLGFVYFIYRCAPLP